MKNVIIDYETYYDNDVSVVGQGNANYSRDADAYIVSVEVEGEAAECGTLAEMGDKLNNLQADSTVRPVAANSNFDQAFFEKYHKPFVLPWHCILDQSVFDRLKVTRFYGVPREKSHLFEYGLSMHMLLDHDFTGRVHWNCDMQVFKNYHKPVDLVMTSLVGIKLTRLLRTSIRTYVSYDSDVSRNLRVENVISLGVCFNL